MSLQLSASLNLTGSFNLSGSMSATQTLNVTSSYSLNSITASYITSSNIVGNVTSASYALSSSFAPTNTNITSSWSNNSLTASYIVNSQTASYYNGSVVSSSYSLSSSYALNAAQTALTTGSTYPITSSWALTSSYTLGFGDSVSASFSNNSNWQFNHNLQSTPVLIQVYDANFNQIIPQNIQCVSDASAVITFPFSASGYAIATKSGLRTVTSLQTASLFTGSTYEITSSWANNSLTASYVVIAQTASYYGGSVLSSSYSITSSYVRNAVSSSYSLSSSYSISASYAPTNANITASFLTTTNNYKVNSFTSSNLSTTGLVNFNSSGSTSFTTDATLTLSGQNTKGGSTNHDFLYVTVTNPATLNPSKHFRLNGDGNFEIINDAYTNRILVLTDSGSLQVPVARSENVTQLSNTGAGIKVGNYGSIFDDGNFHIHSIAPNGNFWLNASGSGMVVINGQTGATGGVCIGTSTQKGYVTIVGSVNAAITQPYGYLISSGAGSTTGTSPNPYSLTCDSRIMSSEFNAPSDERLKNIKGEITLDKAIDFITKIDPIEFTWKEGVDTGLKAGFSAQQTYKAGFEHLIGVVNKPGLEGKTDDDGFVSPQDAQFVMNYEQVTPYHSKIIKHLLHTIEKLESKITELETNIKNLSK